MTDERGFVFHGRDGERELSIGEVRDLAASGDPDGLYALAMAYLFGWDVDQDEGRGYELLERAVDAGQTEAMTLMVRLYMHGEYDGLTPERAAGYAIEAAEDGIPDAQLFAGIAYRDGVSVDVDYARAASYFRLAANRGNHEARTCLGQMYEEGLGVEKDETKAYRLYRTAAKGGDVNAMFRAGVCCEFGAGTTADMDAAMEWYSMAAGQGDAFAMERIGVILSESDPPDLEGAFEWFLKAAMEGVPTSMLIVGRCYRSGRGVGKDPEEAAKWIKLAEDNGLEDIPDYLGSLGAILG